MYVCAGVGCGNQSPTVVVAFEDVVFVVSFFDTTRLECFERM